MTNRLEIEGKAVADVKNIPTKGGHTISSFEIKTPKNKSTFSTIACKAWDSEDAQNIKAGVRVGIVGHLEEDSWTSKTTGKTFSKTVVVADELELALDRGEEDALPPKAPRPVQDDDLGIDGSELPF